jgi:hypothetical protein
MNSDRVGSDADPAPIAQVFVFKDEACLGWDCFYKQTIRIGRDPGMDIRLNDAAVADKHAEVYIKGDKIVVSATTHELELRVNDQRVTSAILNTLDYLTIGPYTLKIKLPQIKNKRPPLTLPKSVSPIADRPHVVEKWRRLADKPEPAASPQNANHFHLIFNGDLVVGVAPETIEAKLCKLLSAKHKTIRAILNKRQTLVLQNLSRRTAQKYRKALSNLGARCKIEKTTVKPKPDTTKDKNQTNTVTLKPIKDPEPLDPKASKDHAVKGAPPKEQSSSPLKVRPTTPVLDEDDDAYDTYEEEEDYVQPFLKATLLENVPVQSVDHHTDHVLEIVKYKGDTVVDFKCLSPKEKYDIRTGTKRFRLAAYKSIESCHVYFSSSHSGYTKTLGAKDRALADLCTTENNHRKKKSIYTIRLLAGQIFCIEDNGFQYRLRLIPRPESPKVSAPVRSTRPIFKNLIKSSGIHLVLVLLLSFFLSIPERPDPRDAEARFVKIDMSQLQKPKPVVSKPKPKRPPQKLTQPKAKVPKKQPKIKRVAQKKPAPQKRPTSSPNAGGGTDVKGNVKTRNIKQTGLLGLIGDGIGLAPKEALASVTNLDVVASSNATDSNLKIGGIPGKLPGTKLELVSGDVVRSKGTQQVLRSAGINGDGEVAALKNGQTGQNKAMAMVSVELNKSVRVQGGMSREAVKRVIDQHLDEISYCYENALIDAPSLMGNIVFEWKILMSGKVGAVRIKSSTIRSGQIHHCIQAAIKTWQFDKPQHSEVMVSYPFVFDIVGF